MTSPEHPLSYNDYALPQIKLEHHPVSSPVPTPVIKVLLDRFARNNAFTDTMVTSLVTAFDLLSTDPRVKAIVFSSADPRNKFFCAGMDLDDHSGASGVDQTAETPSPAELGRQREAHRDGGAQVSLAILRCNKPVIAALNGHAVGVGITMTLPCNLRIVSQDAKVGFVFARRGINMEATSSFFLPRILGTGRALHLVTTGSTYSPSDPLLRDLFAEVVAPAEVLPRALELAGEIAAKTSAVATRAMKDMIYRGASSPEEAERLESRVFFDLFRGSDAREGIRSFLEKREPDFQGVWEREKPAVWPWWETKHEGIDDRRQNGQANGVLGWLKSKI
ncbi:putative Enoyl-CoA hydratase [Seiridium cardinale]|uniref:Enoyl-CoA hydratase n=1 Tax=Seiridium cardinale TaxID=138064 RepID=A0ABR2XUP6_9PEZI